MYRSKTHGCDGSNTKLHYIWLGCWYSFRVANLLTDVRTSAVRSGLLGCSGAGTAGAKGLKMGG